jgi:hypothetical protein
MATSKKTTEAKKPTKPEKPKGSDDFPKAYMRLRTVLDGLEIGALQYCLREETAKERIKKAEEIEKLLLPILDKIKDKPVGPRDVCAEGYYNCGGICVPYQCPTDR